MTPEKAKEQYEREMSYYKKDRTPERKEAERLLNSYYIALMDSDSDKGEEILVTELASKCALIDVDNSIDAIQEAGGDAERNFVDETYMFYERVRTELVKMKI